MKTKNVVYLMTEYINRLVKPKIKTNYRNNKKTNFEYFKTKTNYEYFLAGVTISFGRIKPVFKEMLKNLSILVLTCWMFLSPLWFAFIARSGVLFPEQLSVFAYWAAVTGCLVDFVAVILLFVFYMIRAGKEYYNN